MLRSKIKNGLSALKPNPFDRQLKKLAREGKERILIFWNRGLGDIPLGLYAFVMRIRFYIPDAQITFMTRSDLEEGFKLLDKVQVIVRKDWKRGEAISLEVGFEEGKAFDLVIEKPDPTRWLRWQLGKVVPQLSWQQKWDQLSERFELDPNETYIGCHVQTETERFYGYEKNWSPPNWHALFTQIRERKKGKILLFGLSKKEQFEGDGVIDLRGETTLLEMVALIKNRCSYLIAPDSGILSLIYYIKADFPLKVVSLWSDPKQGILKQNVASPNSALTHLPLIGKKENVDSISVKTLYHALFGEEDASP